MKNLFNFIAFQTVWFAAVLGAAHQLDWAGPLAFAAFTLAHFSFNNSHRREDIILLIIAVSVGTLLDSAYKLSQLLVYQGWTVAAYLAPLWISVLWGNIALTLNHSLSWLRGKILLAILFGAIGAPLSYLAGAHLGALEILPPTWFGLTVIGIAWAVMTPVLTNLLRTTSDEPSSLAQRSTQ